MRYERPPVTSHIRSIGESSCGTFPVHNGKRLWFENVKNENYVSMTTYLRHVRRLCFPAFVALARTVSGPI